MSIVSQESSVLTSRYAAALLNLSNDKKTIDKVEKDLLSLQAMLEGSEDLQRFIASPLISDENAFAVIESLGKKAKFQKVTMNFLGVLVENKRMNVLPGIIKSFSAALSKMRGEVVAQVITASPLAKAQEKEIAKALSAELGRDVIIESKVDENILGGLIVKVGSQMIDDSVARKLERLKSNLVSQEAEFQAEHDAIEEKAA